MPVKVKKTCDGCKRKFRNVTRIKGLYLCWQCKIKSMTSIPSEYTIFQALNKSYKVKPYCKTKDRAVIYVPKALIGRRVRLDLMGEEE